MWGLTTCLIRPQQVVVHLSAFMLLLTVTFLKGLAEHRGDQTHDGRHHIPIASGPPRPEHYASIGLVSVPLPHPRVHVPV